jgi:hypothetical protein
LLGEIELLLGEIELLLRVTDLITPSPHHADGCSVNVKGRVSNMGVFLYSEGVGFRYLMPP